MKYKFNIFTGNFDLVSNGGGSTSGSAADIVTHSYNSAGNELKLYDPIIGQYLPLDYLVVTDEEGNVVTT
jgi:hypothetical protein